MIDIVWSILGLALMCVGVIGYSFQPPPNYIGSEKVMYSVCLYYTTLAIFLFVVTLCDIAEYEICLRLFETIFMVALLAVVLYGIRSLRRIWAFEVSRIRDCLLYGSVVYLMDKQVFSNIAVSVILDVVLLISVICLVVLSGYVILRYRKIRLIMAFENYELISIVYMTAFFIGLCALSGEITETLPYVLTIVLTLYALYVVIIRYVKPLFFEFSL